MPNGWSRIEIGGRPADIFDPSDARFAVLYLHSLSGETPATNVTFTAALQQHRLRCVAPHGGPCWWADRLCPNFDKQQTPERYLLDTVVPWIESAWQLGPRAVALVGVEMGGQGAMRLAFKHPQRFTVAASISGAMDAQEWFGRGTPLDAMYESRERCRLDTAILHIDAHNWPQHIWFCCEPTDAMAYRGNDRLQEKLSAMGISHVADLDTPAIPGLRYVDQMTPAMLQFVATALVAESRRLL